MTFYGEAIGLDWVNPISGSSGLGFGGPVQYLGDGDTYTATGGDEWVVGFYDWDYYPDGDVRAFLVFDNTGGGAGSVTVSYGWDATWSLDPGVATIPAGTHAVAGSGITAVELPGFDRDRYVAGDDQLAIRVQVGAGGFTVDQVRLRIWPAAGVVGGWSEVVTPGEDSAIEQAPGAVVATWLASTYWHQGFATWSASQAENRASLLADAPESAGGAYPLSLTPPFDHTRTRVGDWADAYWISAGEHTGSQTTQGAGIRYALSKIYLEAFPAGVDGVDFIRHPDSTTQYTQPQGEPSYEWLQSVMTVLVTASTVTSSLSDGVSYRIWDEGPHYVQIDTGVASDPVVKPSAEAGDAVYHGRSGSHLVVGDDTYLVGGEIDLAGYDPADPLLLTFFTGGHITERPPADISPVPWLAGDEKFANALSIPILGVTDTPVGSFIADADVDNLPYDRLRYRVTPAPYRYWTPTATTAHPLRLMQRGDGLGMGSGRALSTGTRQHSTRIFGTP